MIPRKNPDVGSPSKNRAANSSPEDRAADGSLEGPIEDPPRGHGSKYERKKDEAIAALLTHRNVEEAARAADIGTQTLLRWLKRPNFQADYREARRAAMSQSNARLQQASGAAVTTLLKIMVDPAAPAAARVRAADCVLKRAAQGLEDEDALVRIDALERVRKKDMQRTMPESQAA
jgi:transposase-like protein